MRRPWFRWGSCHLGVARKPHKGETPYPSLDVQRPFSRVRSAWGLLKPANLAAFQTFTDQPHDYGKVLRDEFD